MAAWVDFAAGRAAGGRHPSRVAHRPDPAPHDAFLWDTGFHWGEWCEPGGNPEAVFTLEQDMGDIATAFLHRSSSLLGRIGGLLGRDDVAERYTALAEATRDAWRTEFIDDDGRLHPDTQANLVRALAFGLVPDDLRATVAERLVELVHEADDHLSTGLPGHAVPAPRVGRHRPPRRGLHPPVPGHGAVLVGDDRPGGDHDLGELGGSRRRQRHRHRLPEPLQQGRGHLVPAPPRRRAPPRRGPPRLRALHRRPDARRRPHLGRGRPRRPPRPGAQRAGSSTTAPSPWTSRSRPAPRPTSCSPTAHGTGPGPARRATSARRAEPYLAIPPETEMSSPVTNDEASLDR